MEMVYLICAATGAGLWMLQFLLGFVGDVDHVGDADFHGVHGGGHGGADAAGHVHGLGWLLGLVSFRSIVAAITFFGLGGLAAQAGNHGGAVSLSAASAAGIAGLLLVAGLMGLIRKASHDGTLRIQNAIGQVGTVYLRIPAHNRGRGKVTVKVQDRLVELQAISNGGELPTGSQIVVVNVVAPDTVEVIPAL